MSKTTIDNDPCYVLMLVSSFNISVFVRTFLSAFMLYVYQQ